MKKYTRRECPAATGEVRLQGVFHLKTKTAFHNYEPGELIRVVHVIGSNSFHYSDMNVCYIIDQKHLELTPDALSLLEDSQYDMDSD